MDGWEQAAQIEVQKCRWHAELEAARTLETEEKYRQYAASLKSHLDSCLSIMQAVSLSLPAHPQSPLSAQDADMLLKQRQCFAVQPSANTPV